MIMERKLDSSDNEEHTLRIAEILGDLRFRGIRVWSEDGHLRYRAPKGTLEDAEIEILRESKEQIVALLERSTPSPLTSERPADAFLRAYRAPLSFSQLWHWNLHQLEKRRSSRHVVSATRLLGPLNVELLRRSSIEIVRRHDALRTRIVVVDGTPMQEIDESVNFELKVDDLTALQNAARESEVRRLIDHEILEPIDLAIGPLFAFRLLKLRDDDCVLIVTMDHLITDGYSINILLRDLFAAYMQGLKGRAFSLPEIAVQLGEYASWQRNTLKSWMQKHGAYWDERLRGYRPVRAPVDGRTDTQTSLGWGSVPVQIGTELKAELQEWCRLHRTTLAMGVFTAYVGLISRWCNASDIVIQQQINNRASPKVENTIGYFTSVLFLRFEIPDDERFVDLMNRVTDEYCKAHEHADFNYLAAQIPRPDFARSNWFNWIPMEPKLDPLDVSDSEGAIEVCPFHFANPAVKTFDWDNDPEFVLFETHDDVVGTLYFPLNRFSIDSMERLTRNLLTFIRELLRQPEQRVKDVALLG